MTNQHRIRADRILYAISKRHRDDVFITEVKTGPTLLARAGELGRIDAVAIKRSWTKPCITGYEVKVDRQDFLRDEKWPMYKALCHRFYFACPRGLIDPAELDPDIGLITYNPDTGGIKTIKSALYRNIEIPTSMLYYIVLSRTDSDRHPFFSDAREMFEAWVHEKSETRTLSALFRSKILRELANKEEQLDAARKEADRFRESADLCEQIVGELRKHGVRVNHWNDWRAELANVMTSGIPDDLMRQIKAVAREAERLRELIELNALVKSGEA